MKIRPNQKGFTLIELLVVIGIIWQICSIVIQPACARETKGKRDQVLKQYSPGRDVSGDVLDGPRERIPTEVPTTRFMDCEFETVLRGSEASGQS